MKSLLSIRHPQKDLFTCDMFITFKDDNASMEHPIFSLSTKSDKRPRKYERNGNTIEIMPSGLGLATIHDKDILLYLASQFMEELNLRTKQSIKDGNKSIEAPPKTLRFIAHNYFILTNRATSKLSYQRLEAGLDRLSGTRIKTNIATNGVRKIENFGIIDSYAIIRQDQNNPNSRMTGIEVKLSDWFYNSLIGYEVLTISNDYFRLRKPLERRIYELCRKHCGTNKQKISFKLETLKEKTGSGAKLKEFRRMMKEIIKSDNLPDYKIEFDPDKKDLFIVRPRKKTEEVLEQNFTLMGAPTLKPQTHANASKILQGSGFDKYAVFNDWWQWSKNREQPKSLDAAYIGFCKMKIAHLR